MSFSGLVLLPLEGRSGILARTLNRSGAKESERMDFPISKILADSHLSRNTILITSREDGETLFWEVEGLAGCLWEKKTYLFFFCRLVRSESCSNKGKRAGYFPEDFSVPENQTERELMVLTRCLAGTGGEGKKGKRWAITQNIKLPQKLYLSMLTI